jgi:hypothetical protein
MPRRPFRLGLAVGLLVGMSVFTGVVLTLQLGSWLGWETPLEAVASTGGDTMAIATGPISEGVEGLFVLDFVTGQLTCQILNPRSGQLGGVYTRNVAGDLGIQQGKQPRYLLITGALQVRQAISNVRPAESLVYVADEASGRYVAYMLPFNKQLLDMNRPQASQMIPVGGGSARNIVLE